MLSFFVQRLCLGATLICLALLGTTTLAQAHSANQSYIFLDVSDTTLTGKIEATLTDLDQVLGLDADGNGEITLDEARAKEAEIFDYLLGHLKVTADGEALTITPTEFSFLELPARTFVEAGIAITGFDQTPESIQATYTGFFSDLEEPHQALAVLSSNTRTGLKDNEANIAAAFDKDDTTQTISLVGLPWLELLGVFIIQGVWHIWLGFDHVLFLATLLIPATMVVVANRWQPETSLREPLIKVTKMVTGFTLAHSVTLSLAALDIVRLPAWIVESIIALSIAYVALTILMPKLHRNMFWVVVIFGFFHGFGFANVLEPINIEPNQKALTLAGFNIGVELGQLAIVLVLFPIFYQLRHTALYRVGIMKTGSVLLIAIALFWFEERAFDLLGPVKPTILGMLGLA